MREIYSVYKPGRNDSRRVSGAAYIYLHEVGRRQGAGSIMQKY